MTSTPEEEAAAKARREKVEKMAGQAFDAASDAANKASELAGKAKAYGQEALKNIDADTIKKVGGGTAMLKPVLGLAVVGALIYAVMGILGGGGPEGTVKSFYAALEKGGYEGVKPLLADVPKAQNAGGLDFSGFAASMTSGIINMLQKDIESRGGISTVKAKCKEFEVRDIPVAKCNVNLTFEDDSEDKADLELKKVDGDWKVAL